MLGFVKKLFAAKPCPIGVDIGTDTIRLAQCAHDGTDWQLAAAACMDIPSGVRSDEKTLHQFIAGSIRELVGQGQFKGREAILSVPSNSLWIQHIRTPRLDEAETRKALPWELKGKLPIDPQQAVLRHMIAGEVQVAGESRNEVIVMATPRQTVTSLLSLCKIAKLEVIGMNVEPKALVDCFGHVYRRKADGSVTSMFVDIGCKTTRVVIANGQQIVFARSIPIGGDSFSQATANALGIGFEQAKLLRIKIAGGPLVRPEPHPEPAPETAEMPESENHSFALLGLAPKQERRQQSDTVAIVAPTDSGDQSQQVDDACTPFVSQLCDELNLCRRYHESTFAQLPVNRIVFIGGEARHRRVCQRIAQTLGLAAQLGDPLVRMSRTTTLGAESGIDFQQPQPAWAVALGLTMGPVAAPQSNTKAA